MVDVFENGVICQECKYCERRFENGVTGLYCTMLHSYTKDWCWCAKGRERNETDG